MGQHVSIRDLRNRGGDIVELAATVGPVTITRAGEPVAQLIALPPAPITGAQLLERCRHLPAVDAAQLRADVDATIDASL